MYLDDQSGNTLQLLPNPLITITSFDISFPAIRAVSESRPDTDGERDTTALYGARAVSLAAGLYATPGALVDQLMLFMAPRKRSYLYVTDSEWVGQRRMLLRADQFAGPVVEGADDVYRAVTAQWKAPDGVWEAVTPTTVIVSAYSVAVVGMTFPVTFPMNWTPTTGYTDAVINNPGQLPLHYTAQIYGQCDGPILTNDTTGQQLAFLPGSQSGLSLAAGVFVTIDTRERSVSLNGDPTQTQLFALDFVNSSWWQLQPGVNNVRFNPSAGSFAGSSAVITYRQTYL